ncbi:Suppressor of SWI4 1 [Nymphon striatum]|nr:Suppressor of SWI4 1 [Nymphon striatum]
MGKSAKNAQKTQEVGENEEVKKAPHSFVIFKGKIGRNVRQLMQNFRHVMEPYTASNLKIRKGNVIKDYVSVAGLLNVTHLVVFSKSDIGVYLKIARLPRGPTMTFKVSNYSLTKDVIVSIKRHVNYAHQFSHHPLLVLNNFSREGMHFKLMSSMFQNMFPSINVNSVKLNDIRRCVLMNYDEESNKIQFRHYTIKVVPTNLSKSVKKLLSSKIPDMGRFEDVSEYLINGGNVSESEGEQDGPENEVELPQSINSRGNVASEQSAIRLIELGPRMDIQLIKIEEGLLDGEVLYHKHFTKTEQELDESRSKLNKKRREKELRKSMQEANKRRKEYEKEKHKKDSLKGMKEKIPNKTPNEDDEDKDEEWYKKEVGTEPDKDLFSKRPKRMSDYKMDKIAKFRKVNQSESKKESKITDYKSKKESKFTDYKSKKESKFTDYKSKNMKKSKINSTRMEFYFSDSNLSKDRFLSHLVQDTEDGYIELEVFKTFNKIKSVTLDSNLIAKALHDSPLLELDHEHRKVRRKTDVLEPEGVREKTIYVEHLPATASHEWIKKLFSQYGEIAYISLPRFQRSGTLKGFAFVEFKCVSSALKACEHFGASCDELKTFITTIKVEEGTGTSDLNDQKVSCDPNDCEETSSINTDQPASPEKTPKQDNKEKKQKKKSCDPKDCEETSSINADQPASPEKTPKQDNKEKKQKKKSCDPNDCEETSSINADQPASPEKPPKQDNKEKKQKKKGCDLADNDETKSRLKRDDPKTEECDSAPESKKFKSSKESEASTDILEPTQSESQPSDLTVKDKKKPKKLKRPHPKELETQESDSMSDSAKKQKLSPEKTETALSETERNPSTAIPEKKSKRGKRKKSRQNVVAEELETISLRVMSKLEWITWRKKYLLIQKTAMQEIKRSLSLFQVEEDSKKVLDNMKNEHDKENEHDKIKSKTKVLDDKANEHDKTKSKTFTAGVILKVSVKNPVTDVKIFKNEVKKVVDVAFIEIAANPTIYIRCHDEESAKKLMEQKDGIPEAKDVYILQGDEEKCYWKKIEADREEKLSSKKKSTRMRGFQRVIKKAEIAAKHIQFDECGNAIVGTSHVKVEKTAKHILFDESGNVISNSSDSNIKKEK